MAERNSSFWPAASIAASNAVLILALAFAGATVATAPRMAGAERPPFGYEPMKVPNGCFVESVSCFDAFHEKFGEDGWVRVLQWGAKEDEVMVAGHAVTVFETAGVLWCWDVNHGWTPLSIAPAERDDAGVVAAPIVANYPRVTALYPILWDDGAQAPEAGPAGAEPSADAAGPQYARIAAARLARHRPVNVIEFTQTEDGQSRTSEAVVFVFGGRMCIYSPQKGTTTFRARSSVWNVHLTMEMVRRIFPGAEGVRSIALPAPES
jgi:hypothetical protein